MPNFDKYVARQQAEYLNTPGLVALTCSSRENYALFQPLLNERKLFHYVQRGNQNEVRALLAKDVLLLNKKIKANVAGQSLYMSISQYMLWALNKRQFENMLSCLPNTEESKKLSADLSIQYGVLHDLPDIVRQLLPQNIESALQKRNIIDCSGRMFINISLFQYTLWALDSHAWGNIVDCVPKNEQRNLILEQLLLQYQSMSEGVCYFLNGNFFQESHFNFQQTIIKQLEEHLDATNAVVDNVWASVDQQWVKGVGGAQRLLPMHVVNEYCSTRLFKASTDFTTYLSSTKKFTNPINEQEEYWFTKRSSLGVSLAVFKGKTAEAFGVDDDGRKEATPDLAAMKALLVVKERSFNMLGEKLIREMTPNNQPSSPNM